MPQGQDAIDALIGELGLREPGPQETAVPRIYCDPHWNTVGASLRLDSKKVPSIFLKMPVSRLGQIMSDVCFAVADCRQQATRGGEAFDSSYLIGFIEYMKNEYFAARSSSVFLCVSVEKVKEDLQALKEVRKNSKKYERLNEFIEGLEAGLRSDPAVDWITRCGGPECDVSGEKSPPQG